MRRGNELPARIWAPSRGCDLGNGAVSRGHAAKLESKAMMLGRGASPMKNPSPVLHALGLLGAHDTGVIDREDNHEDVAGAQARLDGCLTPPRTHLRAAL